MEKRFLKNENGISMVTLITTIILLLIISTVVIYNSRTSVHLEKLNQMYADLQTLQDKVDIYYIENGKLPISDNPNDTITVSEGETIFGIEPTENDGEIYYKIDSNLLGNIDLNYDTTYYVNEQSHIVYSSDGVNIDGNEYHRINQDYENIYQDVNPETTFTITFLYRNDEETLTVEPNTKIYLKNTNNNENESLKSKIDIINEKAELTAPDEEFLGWTLNPSTVGDTLDEIIITQDITLYIKYKTPPIEYMIEYILIPDTDTGNPASHTNPVTITQGKSLKLNNPYRPNYVSEKWYGMMQDNSTVDLENNTLTPSIVEKLDTTYQEGEITKHKITLYASWIEAVAKIDRNGTSIYFSTIQNAVKAAQNGETIDMIKSSNEDNIVIDNNKDITINLNGLNIISSSGDCAIENNGTLTIISNTESGTIESTNGVGIINNGTLTLGTYKDSVPASVPYIKGASSALENNSTFNFYDGKLEGKIQAIIRRSNKYSSRLWCSHF